MPTPEDDPVRVDFRTKDTEWGWMRRVDKLALVGVPAWFNLLGWIALLSGIEYLRRQSGSAVLGYIVMFSTLLIWRYLTALMERVEFIGILPAASPKKQFWISALISGIIVFFGGLLVVKTVHIIADLTESQAIVAPAMEAQPSKKK